MVSLADVRAHNATLRSLPPGLVAIFVGGTSGIGLFTARELARNTTSPHIYLVGRNQAEATRIGEELRTINSSSKVDFIQKDVSLLKNVDEACKEIQAKEQKINLLFLTCGYLTLKGRDETTEGLDRKFSLSYYARMRFAQLLSPQLEAAAKANELSRVVSVLDPQPGMKLGRPNFDDLSLKNGFSLKNCMIHSTTMTNLTVSRLAKDHPSTTFIHAYPSGVNTGVLRETFGSFEPIMKRILGLAKFLFVEQQESGERHLYASTAPQFAPRAASSKDEAALGSDAVKGSGSYLLNWNGDILTDTAKAKSLRDEGKEQVVWDHTQEVFKKICEENGKY